MTLMPTERQKGMKVKEINQCGPVAQAHAMKTNGKWIAPTKEFWEKTFLGISCSSKMSVEY